MQDENTISNISSIKSKQRVADHGEVFTGEREVNAMLDLVKQETERIESRFLEPACGTGNFLSEIFSRKLLLVEKKYKKSQSEFEQYSLLAAASIYGIDILPDNVIHCKERLFNVFNTKYNSLYKKKSKDKLRNSILYVLERNILCGDALTLKTVSENNYPIIFSEWSLVRSGYFQRRDFAFEELSVSHNNGLFDTPLISDTGEHAFIPTPIKTFPLTHYLNIADVIDDNL